MCGHPIPMPMPNAAPKPQSCIQIILVVGEVVGTTPLLPQANPVHHPNHPWHPTNHVRCTPSSRSMSPRCWCLPAPTASSGTSPTPTPSAAGTPATPPRALPGTLARGSLKTFFGPAFPPPSCVNLFFFTLWTEKTLQPPPPSTTSFPQPGPGHGPSPIPQQTPTRPAPQPPVPLVIDRDGVPPLSPPIPSEYLTPPPGNCGSFVLSW